MLAVDQASVTGPTRTVWTFADAAGTVSTTAWFDEGTSQWQRYHRLFDGRGNITQEGGDAEAALQQVPIVWRGLRQAEVGDLYLAGQSVYDPQLGRYVTQASTGDANPYRFEGNRPTSPDPAFVTSPEADTPSLLRSVIGDETLANASDAQLYGTVGVVAIGTGLTGGPGLAALGGGVTIGAAGTVLLSGSTAAGLALSTASLTVSGATVAFTGGEQGRLDLALDAASLGIARGLGVARGLTRGGLLLADASLNTFQGIRSSALSQQAFAQGDFLGGSLNAAGTLLGFASAGFRGAELNSLLRTDPRANPLNFRVRFDAVATLNSTGAGNVRLEFRNRSHLERGWVSNSSFHRWRFLRHLLHVAATNRTADF